MGKNKLKRWEELKKLERVFQPEINYYSSDYELKGNWRKLVFKNNNPLILEAGCGKGEYTVEMARNDAGRNFIGMDIKGARLWRGAVTIHEENLLNAAFLRLRLELIEKYFAPSEADEIWLTFPDPQPQKSRENRRLTSPDMLQRFFNILKNDGLLHLKTDSAELLTYTQEVLKHQQGKILCLTFDLDHAELPDQRLKIQTTYERIYRNEGKKICYLCFRLKK
jgi:tRNA (guanine-N7-)-methyltransferase